MDKCPKNMILVALKNFRLITILDFFQDTFVSILKTKRPSDYYVLNFPFSCFVKGRAMLNVFGPHLKKMLNNFKLLVIINLDLLLLWYVKFDTF